MIPASPAGVAVIPAPAKSDSSASRVATRRLTRSASGACALPEASTSCQSVREFALHAVDPPAGCDQRATGSATTALVQRFALPQKAPQQRVDERLGGRSRQRRRRIHGVIDDRERRRARVLELIDRDGDETAERRIGDRLRRERANERVEPAPMPQRAVGKLDDERAAPAG